MIPKTSSSLFNSTNFEYLARNIGLDTIAVTGFLTDQCVDHTIRDGADRGFHMICVGDACATDTRARHAAALNAFKGYCRMETTDSLLAAMARDFAASPRRDTALTAAVQFSPRQERSEAAGRRWRRTGTARTSSSSLNAAASAKRRRCSSKTSSVCANGVDQPKVADAVRSRRGRAFRSGRGCACSD